MIKVSVRGEEHRHCANHSSFSFETRSYSDWPVPNSCLRPWSSYNCVPLPGGSSSFGESISAYSALGFMLLPLLALILEESHRLLLYRFSFPVAQFGIECLVTHFHNTL